jgi:hypothetical protein
VCCESSSDDDGDGDDDDDSSDDDDDNDVPVAMDAAAMARVLLQASATLQHILCIEQGMASSPAALDAFCMPVRHAFVLLLGSLAQDFVAVLPSAATEELRSSVALIVAALQRFRPDVQTFVRRNVSLLEQWLAAREAEE